MLSDVNDLGGMSPGQLKLDGILQRLYLKVDECGINAHDSISSIDLDISETRPFVITRIGQIRDAQRNRQGLLDYANQPIYCGDVVVSIDGGRHSQKSVSYMKRITWINFAADFGKFQQWTSTVYKHTLRRSITLKESSNQPLILCWSEA
jgi:hypothetical protein